MRPYTRSWWGAIGLAGFSAGCRGACPSSASGGGSDG